MINDGQAIILTFDYTLDELYEASLFALRRNNVSAYFFESYRRLAVSAIISFAVFYYLGWAALPALFWSVAVALSALVVPLVFFYISLIIAARFYDEYRKSGDSKPVTLPATFTFDDKGFERRLEAEAVKSSWEKVTEAVETEDAIFIFQGRFYANLIPKRVFADAGELNQLKSLLVSKLGERAKF